MFKQNASGYTTYRDGRSNWKDSRFHNALRRNDVKAWALFGLIGFIMSAVVTASTVYSRPASDSDNCVVGRLPDQAVLMGIDLTDEVWPSEEQLRKVRERIEHHRDHLGIGDRLSIYALISDSVEQKSELRKLFSACRPQSPDTINRAVQGVFQVKKRYAKEWLEPIKVAMEQIQTNTGRGSINSPLMASLQYMASRPTLRAKKKPTIEVFSDLLEYDRISHYQPNWPTFDELVQKKFDITNIEGIFAGTNVRVWQFIEVVENGGTSHQTPQHEAFWNDWMEATKANYSLSRF